jgi:hypothetical protein
VLERLAPRDLKVPASMPAHLVNRGVIMLHKLDEQGNSLSVL